MEDSQYHHSCLNDVKALKKMDAVSHGEGSQKVDDENHRMEDLQVGLKHFVLEFSSKVRR
jgi:hypothetical protein